jgi:hypothetical protein
MFFKSSVWPLAMMLSVSTAATLGAQSLADVARQEEARRREIRKPAKVYTNKDLAIVPPPAAAPTPGDKPAAAAAPTPGDKPATPPATDGAKVPPQTPDAKDQGAIKDQKYWSGRMQDLLAQRDRDQVYTEALQSRINGLTAELTVRDDAAQRAVITRDRQKAIDELDRLKVALQRTATAIADLEEEARRASVPPGWLR